jgi:hypothetical protein
MCIVRMFFFLRWFLVHVPRSSVFMCIPNLFFYFFSVSVVFESGATGKEPAPSPKRAVAPSSAKPAPSSPKKTPSPKNAVIAPCEGEKAFP